VIVCVSVGPAPYMFVSLCSSVSLSLSVQVRMCLPIFPGPSDRLSLPDPYMNVFLSVQVHLCLSDTLSSVCILSRLV
jgi:hypothetical protein